MPDIESSANPNVPVESTSVSQLFLGIWLRPRATMRAALLTKRRFLPAGLFLIAGFLNALDQAIARNLGDQFDLSWIFLAAFLGGGIGGLVCGYIYAFVVRLIANLIGGSAEYQAVCLAIALGRIPSIIGGIAILLQIACVGNDLFKLHGHLPRWFVWWVYVPTVGMEIVFFFWSLITTCKCVGEACGFSAWRAALALFVPIAAFLFVTTAVVVLLALLH